MSGPLTFETPEDVGLRFEPAGPGSRIAAGLIDLMIIGTLIGAALAAGVSAGILAFEPRAFVGGDFVSEVGAATLTIVVAVVSGINLGYFIGCEWLWDGRSPGKRMMGLTVVRDGGYPLDLGASLIRNVARLVDMLPGPYLVALASVLMSRDGKRLGDFMAGTLVVRHRTAAPPPVVFEGERYSKLEARAFELGRELLGRLGPEALSVLDGYFERAAHLDEGARSALARTLSESLAEQMSMSAPAGDHGQFLKEIYLALRERLQGH